jgi:N-dimethylarginine dimethylaminohydrolase
VPVAVIRRVSELPPGFRIVDVPAAPVPSGVLVCAPDAFDVVDVKNPHMASSVGRVDRRAAREQWEDLVEAFESAGLDVEIVEPEPECEDMVFTANQTLTGVDAAGHPTALVSRMRHASRRREVPALVRWFRAHDWRVADDLPDDVNFEGAGDVVWHPGRRLAWAGHGFRSSARSHAVVAEVFGALVVSLRLRDERFYHLDTCLCPLDETRALIVREAFDPEGIALLGSVFHELIDCDYDEAVTALACNAVVLPGNAAIVDRRAERTIEILERHVPSVMAVDTGEFLKSGGSVFCLKQWLYRR